MVPLDANVAHGLPRISCASVPRSGHHMLQQLLKQYFGERHHYCQFYDGPLKRADCCGTYPCTNMDVNYQKNHDLALKSAKPENSWYIVQYRHPIKAAVSGYELGMEHEPAMKARDSKVYWEKFAQKELAYFQKFMKRWVYDAPEHNRLLVEYDRFTDSPIDGLRRVVAFIEPDATPDETRLAAAVGHRGVKSRRSITQFRYYDETFFCKLENKVAKDLMRMDIPFLMVENQVHHAATLTGEIIVSFRSS
jgi:hypothetical protein